ncbi:hypothetical protein PGTUg99_000183, partial [Puccinia graminis f. sp. tritici]
MVLDELPQDMVHHPLERARRVHQSKRHNKPFIMATASIGPKSTVYLSAKSLKRLARGSSEPNANGSSTGTSSQAPTTPLDSVNASSFSYAPDHKLLPPEKRRYEHFLL